MKLYIKIMIYIFLFLGLSWQIYAKEIKKNAIGIRAGISNFNEEDFLSYELIGQVGLPWSWTLGNNGNWQIDTLATYSLGILDQSGDTAFLGTIAPDISLGHKLYGIIFDIGVGGAIVSQDRIGKHNFGGNFQFAAHGGITYILGWNIAIGYRFFHLSDGGINNGHGLNRHLLELSYRF